MRDVILTDSFECVLSVRKKLRLERPKPANAEVTSSDATEFSEIKLHQAPMSPLVINSPRVSIPMSTPSSQKLLGTLESDSNDDSVPYSTSTPIRTTRDNWDMMPVSRHVTSSGLSGKSEKCLTCDYFTLSISTLLIVDSPLEYQMRHQIYKKLKCLCGT